MTRHNIRSHFYVTLKTLAFLILCYAICSSQADGNTQASVIQSHQKGVDEQANFHSVRLTEGWQYVRGDVGGIWEVFRPRKKGSPENVPIWQAVSLPHCFNSSDAVDPDLNYYQGPGWYKNILAIEQATKNGRMLLHFEGAGQKTQVYVYTTKVAKHVGGYDEWSVDITDAVEAFKKSGIADQFASKVPIAIRCDNSRDIEMIPSDLSDFNLYGGLYRYLNLQYVPSIYSKHVELDASIDLQANQGIVEFSAIHQQCDTSEPSQAVVELDIYDPNGKHVVKQSYGVKKYETKVSYDKVSIDEPMLWSTDQPNLYKCKVKTISFEGTQEVIHSIGFRQTEWIKKGPFLLNGKRLLLRGTHRHEDHAGLGAAMSEDLLRQEIEMMKEMGVNFIRLGHYQQSRIVLDLCDQLGILVWEEIPWCRGGLGGAEYQHQAKEMLVNMITQHRNHPSVIIWGLGNENDWPNDFASFNKDDIRVFMKELNDLVHQIDPSRKTAIRRCAFCKDIVDVYSPSIWAGWYRGKFTDYKSVSQKEMEGVDHYLHVEWGASNHARRHSEAPERSLKKIASGQSADERDGDATMYGGVARVSKDGDWTETYACDLIDWHLKEQETMPWLTGTAYWPFKDFSTPVRPNNPVPYVNQKGVIERDFEKKEAFYVFQSYWTENPMVRIYGHTWPVRWGRLGQKRTVKVYSNCDKAELFLNGESMGERQRDSQNYPAAGLRWEVVFKQGENSLKVIANKGDQQVSDEVDLDYQTEVWKEPTTLELSTVRQIGDRIIEIAAVAKDKNGVRCLDAKNVVEFGIAGEGWLVDNLGTSRGSRKLEMYNGRALIRVNSAGKSVVSVSAQGLDTGFLNLEN